MLQPTVIVDIAVPGEALSIGRPFAKYPHVELTLEQISQTADENVALVWVAADEASALQEALREDSLSKRVEALTEIGGRTLLEIRLTAELDAICSTVADANAEVISGERSATEWELRLHFRTREQFGAFRAASRKLGLPIRIRRIFNPTWPTEENPLTEEQTDALATAWKNGYFEVPRRCSLQEVAAELNISDNSASQRIRRGLSTLVGTTVVADQ